MFIEVLMLKVILESAPFEHHEEYLCRFFEAEKYQL